MKYVVLILFSLFACGAMVCAEPTPVPGSLSPNKQLHAVMDIDRDPTIDPEWKEDSYPRIEITRISTGKVVTSIPYFGSPGDDQRPLREHVAFKWRADSKAFSVTVDDRFYSSTEIHALDEDGKFVSVAFPSYKEMTGFPAPDSDHLRPRGRATVKGWDKDGSLIYDLFSSPLATFTGNDPLVHRVYLKVSAKRMITVKVDHEKGEWRNGDWIPDDPKQGGSVNQEDRDD
jgi:hypothetical protein